MEEITNLLLKVYDLDQVRFIKNELQNLIEKYAPIIKNDKLSLTEKDVVLITYGSQVYKKDETNLQTLNKLLTEQLKEEISIVHLLPFYPFCSDDGFSVIDYYSVNPDLGNWDDIISISRNFKLLFDAVINHTSRYCEWFKKFMNNEDYYKNYYIEIDDPAEYSNVVRPRTTPLIHSFESNGIRKTVWTTFSENQVDLNFKEPKVFLQVMDILLFYISKGAHIIRLDAVGFLWKEKNTASIHLPQTHALIKVMRKVIEQIPSSAMLLSETNVPHNENISYFGNGNEAHMVYNFTLPPLLAYSILSGNTKKFTEWAQTLETPYSNVCYFNFLASHDGIGLRPVDHILNEEELNIVIDSAKANGGQVSYKLNPDGKQSPYEVNCNYFSLLKGPEKDEELGIQRIILAHAVLLTMPGLPAIYFHSMFGSENDVKGMNESGINRRINRQRLEYNDLMRVLTASDSRQARILNNLKKLIRIKKNEPAFNPYNPFRVERPGKGIFSLTRISSNGMSEVKSFYNLGTEKITLPLEYPETKTDLINGNSYKNRLELNPLDFVWLKIK